MLNSSRVFTLYGLFLIAAGCCAFAAAGFEAKAKTAVIIGSITGLSMMICGYFAPSRPLASSIGRALTCIYGAIFLWRGNKLSADPSKAYLYWTFVTLSVVSAVVVALLVVIDGRSKQQLMQDRSRPAASESSKTK